MKTASLVLLLTAAPLLAANPLCETIFQTTSLEVKQSPETILETVAKQVAANETCAGDVVKAAIIASKADKQLVAQIVETAVTAAPKQLETIAKTAIAFASDVHTEIATVLQRIDSGQGTAQVGGRKVSPIDFPGGKIVPFRSIPSEKAAQLWTGGTGVPNVTQ